MRTFAMILLLAVLAARKPAAQPRRTARAGNDLLRSVRAPRGLCREDLPGRVRDQEGDEDLLVRRVPGDLSSDARVPPRLLRVPAAAPLRTSKMREEAGQEGVPGRGSRLQVRRAAPLPRLLQRRIDRRSRMAPNPPPAPAAPGDPAGAVDPGAISETAESKIDGWLQKAISHSPCHPVHAPNDGWLGSCRRQTSLQQSLLATSRPLPPSRVARCCYWTVIHVAPLFQGEQAGSGLARGDRD